MDKQTAKNELKKLRDSLSKVLDGKEYSSSEEIKEQSQEAIQQARSASKQVKKSILERIKDLPVVQKVSELGTAGTVAISTATVAQTDLAVSQTEVFVANVANDVVEERFEVPMFIDTFVDFHTLNDWGQVVLTERVAEAQEFVSEAQTKVEAFSQPQTSQLNSESLDTKQETSVSSQDSSSDSPSDNSSNNTEQKSEEKESKVEEKSSSEETKNDSEKDKEDKQEQAPQEKTEDKQQSQKNNSSSEPSTESNDVKSIPIIETPFDSDDQSIRQISPTL